MNKRLADTAHHRLGTLVLVTLLLMLFGRALASEATERGAERDWAPVPRLDYVVSQDDTPVPSECRTGVTGILESYGAFPWVPTLEAGWFGSVGPWETEGTNSRFSHQVRVRQVIKNGVRQDDYTVYPELGFGIAPNGLPRLGWYLQKSPGSVWIIGNEMDVDNIDQDNMMPQLYARAYHELYHHIKSIDPSAKIAVGPVSMVTPGRLQYLDIFWNTYRLLYGVDVPFDAWTFHAYILPERTLSATPQNADGKIAVGTDPELALRSSGGNSALCPNPATPEIDPRPDVVCVSEHDSLQLFRGQILAMREWLTARVPSRAAEIRADGTGGIVLDLTEYTLLFAYDPALEKRTGCGGRIDEWGNCFDPARAARYVRATTNYLRTATDPVIGNPADGGKLVQRWQWYSLHTTYRSGQVSNLLVNNYRDFKPGDPAALTDVGRELLASGRPYQERNLTGGRGTGVSAYAESARSTADVNIRISYRNGGTRAVVEPFTVTFYSDAQLTKLIGSTQVVPKISGIIDGCDFQGQRRSVSIEWRGLPVGTHYYWAKIDSADVIPESDESDNITARGVVRVYDAQRFNHRLFLPALRNP